MNVGVAHGIGFELSANSASSEILRTGFAERELRPIARESNEAEDCPPELLAKAWRSAGHRTRSRPSTAAAACRAVTSSLMAEELSWGCAGLAAPIGATMYPVRPLLRAGTEEQKQRWLTRLASEDGCLAAIAFTEPGAG